MAELGNYDVLEEGGMVQPLLITESEPGSRLSWATQCIPAHLLISLPVYMGMHVLPSLLLSYSGDTVTNDSGFVLSS